MAQEQHIHPLVTMDALRLCEDVQRRVWGYGEREIVPAAQMRAVLHAGGMVAGAFLGRELVGFLYAFPALAHEEGLAGSGLHSHMMAVLPEARGFGFGRRLKWYQRRFALERGIDWVTWTFDPLQSGNARLNVEHLGVLVHEYQVDFYGILGGALSGELPTDRFVALWYLDSARVAQRATDDPYAAHELWPSDRARGEASAVGGMAGDTETHPSTGGWALSRAAEGDAPSTPVLGLDGAVVWTAIPRAIGLLRQSHHPDALRWAESFRAAASDLVERGYQVFCFKDGAYGWFRKQSPK
jgi:predicted GNAT superfamily acetyltransferase